MSGNKELQFRIMFILEVILFGLSILLCSWQCLYPQLQVSLSSSPSPFSSSIKMATKQAKWRKCKQFNNKVNWIEMDQLAQINRNSNHNLKQRLVLASIWTLAVQVQIKNRTEFAKTWTKKTRIDLIFMLYYT